MTTKSKKQGGKVNRQPAPYKPQNPWDVPLRSPKGDAYMDSIFLAVGRALSAWEEYEETLALLFSAIIGWRASLLSVTNRAYGSIVTNRGRIEMLEAAAAARFLDSPHAKYQASLAQVLKNAGRYSPRRNEIAHGILRGADLTAGGEGYYLFPSSIAANKYVNVDIGIPGFSRGSIRRPRYAYTSAQIDYFRGQFEQLTVGARAVFRDLAKWKPKVELLPLRGRRRSRSA